MSKVVLKVVIATYIIFFNWQLQLCMHTNGTPPCAGEYRWVKWNLSVLSQMTSAIQYHWWSLSLHTIRISFHNGILGHAVHLPQYVLIRWGMHRRRLWEWNLNNYGSEIPDPNKPLNLQYLHLLFHILCWSYQNKQFSIEGVPFSKGRGKALVLMLNPLARHSPYKNSSEGESPITCCCSATIDGEQEEKRKASATLHDVTATQERTAASVLHLYFCTQIVMSSKPTEHVCHNQAAARIFAKNVPTSERCSHHQACAAICQVLYLPAHIRAQTVTKLCCYSQTMWKTL